MEPGGLGTGSGRSIPGLHLRDAIDLVSKREPGLILRFGGHSMAAGLTLREMARRRVLWVLAALATVKAAIVMWLPEEPAAPASASAAAK